MRGLEQLRKMSDDEAAKSQKKRYEQMRDRAVRKGNWGMAKQADGRAEDYRRFLDKEIHIYPGGDQAKAGKFEPSVGRDFGPQPDILESFYVDETTVANLCRVGFVILKDCKSKYARVGEGVALVSQTGSDSARGKVEKLLPDMIVVHAPKES